MRQQQSSSADSVGSGGGGTATTQATTAAEAARAARRNRIAGTGIPTSPRANAASGVSSASSGGGGGGINKPAIGSGSGNRRVGGSPSAAEVAAAFEDLGMPSMNGTGGNGNRSGNAKQNGAAVGIDGTSVNGRDRASAGTSTRSGSVRRSGNTILSSGAAGSSNANATNAAAGSSARAAMPSPQDVADEFVGRRRLQQQRARQQQQQQQHGPAGMDVTMSNAQKANANANAARSNNSLRESTTSPIRSRNTAAVKNYVASSTNNASTTSTATSTTTTPTRYAMVESPSKTPSTSNRKKQPLRVETHSGTRSANGTTATAHSVASPDTHLGSVNSSELGSLASPAAASTVADSLAYSQNTSKDSSGFGGLGGGGLGDDMLSGRATNDIPATTTAAKMMSNGDSGGVASAGDGEWSRSNAVRQNDSTQPQPQPQPRLQMRNGTQSTANAFGATGSNLTADSADDNFDDGTHGGGSITSRYDDLSKLSSRYSRPDRVMAPVDERPQLANPNGTSRSFDSYENKSHATHATAITYGQHDTNSAVGGGVGASTAAGNGGGSAKRDGTSIDVVTQSFSPTQKGSAYPSSQASVGTSRPNGTFDDEDTNTIGSQLTDDRSWSRSVNLRQQQLRAQGRDYDDDADSRGSRRRRTRGKKGGKDSSGEGDLTGWALNADDMNHFKEQVDQPQLKAALGASAAVVAGGKSLYDALLDSSCLQ